jgi:hypothetical protein
MGTPREAQLAAHSQEHVLPIPHVLLVINARNHVMGQRRDKPWHRNIIIIITGLWHRNKRGRVDALTNK